MISDHLEAKISESGSRTLFCHDVQCVKDSGYIETNAQQDTDDEIFSRPIFKEDGERRDKNGQYDQQQFIQNSSPCSRNCKFITKSNDHWRDVSTETQCD
ncbi:MAG: hypothetical protein ACI9UK_001842 [Candidatus Krumholzibacteriia bacterium]|jgi:hypothetical protein